MLVHWPWETIAVFTWLLEALLCMHVVCVRACMRVGVCVCVCARARMRVVFVGNWKQWKWKLERKNGKQKRSKLDANES